MKSFPTRQVIFHTVGTSYDAAMNTYCSCYSFSVTAKDGKKLLQVPIQNNLLVSYDIGNELSLRIHGYEFNVLSNLCFGMKCEQIEAWIWTSIRPKAWLADTCDFYASKYVLLQNVDIYFVCTEICQLSEVGIILTNRFSAVAISEFSKSLYRLTLKLKCT